MNFANPDIPLLPHSTDPKTSDKDRPEVNTHRFLHQSAPPEPPADCTHTLNSLLSLLLIAQVLSGLIVGFLAPLAERDSKAVHHPVTPGSGVAKLALQEKMVPVRGVRMPPTRERAATKEEKGELRRAERGKPVVWKKFPFPQRAECIVPHEEESVLYSTTLDLVGDE